MAGICIMSLQCLVGRDVDGAVPFVCINCIDIRVLPQKLPKQLHAWCLVADNLDITKLSEDRVENQGN